MTARLVRGTVSINGGPPLPAELNVTQDYIDVSTNLPQPDPRWTASDAAGHFHAVSADGSYPTLVEKVEHRDCDGACGGECEGDGYDVTVRTCRLCGEQVTPGTTPGPHYGLAPGRMSWTVKFDGPALMGDVSVRYDAGGGTVFFGTAHAEVASWTLEVGREPAAQVVLFGTSPLGRIGPEPVERVPADEALKAAIADLDTTLRKLRERAA